MVTARLTVVEHAKQLVSHGAHAHPQLEQCDDVVPALSRSKESNP